MLSRMSKRALRLSCFATSASLLTIDVLDLRLDLLELLEVLASQQRQGQDLGAVEGGGAVLDQGAPGGEQLGQAVDGGVRGGAHLGLQRGAETGEHGRIDRVSLDTLAGGLGKAAGLPRVDLDAGEVGLGEGFLHAPMVGAGGLEDDAGWLLGGDPGDQRGNARLVVGELSDDARGMGVGVEMVL